MTGENEITGIVQEVWNGLNSLLNIQVTPTVTLAMILFIFGVLYIIIQLMSDE